MLDTFDIRRENMRDRDSKTTQFFDIFRDGGRAGLALMVIECSQKMSAHLRVCECNTSKKKPKTNERRGT